MKKEWAAIPERGSLLAMIAGIRILNFFGYTAGMIFGSLAVVYFFLSGRVSRRASRQYLSHLEQASPETGVGPSLKNVFLHHWHFGINIIDRMYFWQGKMARFRFTYQGREKVHEYLNAGQGVLMIGAHMGSFDAMRAFSQKRGLRVNVVMYQSHARKFNFLLKRLNPAANLNVIDLDGSDMGRIFELKEMLEAGEVVAILGDRAAPFGTIREHRISFLGEPAPFPQNPWILAGLLGCPVFFANAVRKGKRQYHIMIEPLAEKILMPRKDRQERIRFYMAEYVAKIEQLCKKHPFEWFNFYDFWPKADLESAKRKSP